MWITSIRNWLSNLVTWLGLHIGVIKDIFTVLAIIVGGIWTWMLFSTYRESYPRLSIEHRITHRRLSNEQILLIVDANTSNIGKRAVKPLVGWFEVDQILALTKEQLDKLKVGELHPLWPQVIPPTWFIGLDLRSERRLEPGESETQHQEVIVNSSLKAVRVYTFFAEKPTGAPGGQMPPREAAGSFGWDRYSVYDLQEPGVVRCTGAAQAGAGCARSGRSRKPARHARGGCGSRPAAGPAVTPAPLHH